MMFSIEKLKSALNVLPFSEETKKSIIEQSEVVIDFRKFIAEKNNTSEEEADSIINIKLANIYSESNISIEETISVALDKISEYAASEGYKDPEALKNSIGSLYKSLSFK